MTIGTLAACYCSSDGGDGFVQGVRRLLLGCIATKAGMVVLEITEWGPSWLEQSVVSRL